MPGDDRSSQLLDELCAILHAMLRGPHLALPPADAPPPHVAERRRVRARMSAVELASLLLGASLALMLGGCVTFMIGFMLMPWVIGFVMVLYFVGIVSSLLCPNSGPSTSSPKEMSGPLFSKFPII